MKLKLIFSLALLVALLNIASCDHSKKNEEDIKLSSTNSNKSHNIVQNCMNCHKPGGDGEGIFRVVGTVYDSLLINTNANGFIDLYTRLNGGGTFVKRIAVDPKGNFYTTVIIGLGNGLYPSVISKTGNKNICRALLLRGHAIVVMALYKIKFG